MADLEIPEDAIKALQAWEAADAEWLRLALEHLAGEASRETLRLAGAVRDGRLADLQALDWWETVDPLKAYVGLRRAVRDDAGQPDAG